MITGSLVAIATPMHKDGSLDFEAYRALVDWHVAKGTNAIVAVGTTGESKVPLAMRFWADAELVAPSAAHATKMPTREGAPTYLVDARDWTVFMVRRTWRGTKGCSLQRATLRQLISRKPLTNYLRCKQPPDGITEQSQYDPKTDGRHQTVATRRGKLRKWIIDL
jgi:hypothetical protein